MNKLLLIGRLTKDAELRYTQEGLAIARFTLAVDKEKKKEEGATADFINITAFSKLAENIEKYTGKGKLIAINGRIETGSYEKKEGEKVYTTNIIAEKVQFLEWKDKNEEE